MVIEAGTIQNPAPRTEANTKAAPDPAARERKFRAVLCCISGLVALGLLGHLVVLLWAQHDLTPVEALVALHSNMLVHSDGLYYDLNRYPFTVSPYGPIFYGASALLHRLGLPPYHASRVISFSALLVSFWLGWRILSRLTSSIYARAAGVLLAASTANLLFWGTVGQVDMLAACFSLAAFAAFLKFREQRTTASLVVSGILVVLAVFTKQTSLAAGAAIGLMLLIEDRKRAAAWIAAVAAIGISIALALNAYTSGRYFDDAVWANINPFSFWKLQQHLRYLFLTGSAMILVASAGLWHITRRIAPLYLYAGFSACVWLLTAPKIGSDLNYQIEMMLVLSLCAACTLDQTGFFPKLFAADRAWVTLLQIPLLLHVAVNLLVTARVLVERVVLEPAKARETLALKPFVDRPGRVFSPQYDSLVHYRGRIEVEPLIYILLVQAGRSDPVPVLHDLQTRQFATVILGQNLFEPTPEVEDPETPYLPAAQLEAIRNNYRLAAHVEGPNDVYVYEPKSD